MNKRDVARIIEQNGSGVYRFCFHLTGSREEADDLYQDTLLKLFEIRRRVLKEGNPESYIKGIAMRLWKNRMRNEANRQRIIPLQEYREELDRRMDEKQRQPEEEILHREMLEEVRASVRCLPEKIREVMYLYYAAEMSVKEIAEFLNIPQGTVKSRLSTGRGLSKRYLEVRNYGKQING